MTEYVDQRLEALAELPENLRYSYIDKFQVQKGPLNQPPYKCAGCGNHIMSAEQDYIDWGFSVDFYGQVVFCGHCFRQAANQLYYMDPNQVRQLVEAKSKLIRENSDLINEVTELRNALAAIGVVTRHNPPIERSPLPVDPRQEENREYERRDLPVESGTTDEDELPTPPAEPEPVRQSSSERSAELRGDDTLERLLGDSI